MIEMYRAALQFEAKYGVMVGPEIKTLIDFIALHQRNGYLIEFYMQKMRLLRTKDDGKGVSASALLADIVMPQNNKLTEHRNISEWDALKYDSSRPIADIWADNEKIKIYKWYECKRRDLPELLGYKLLPDKLIHNESECSQLPSGSLVYFHATKNNYRYVGNIENSKIYKKHDIFWKDNEWNFIKISSAWQFADIVWPERVACLIEPINAEQKQKSNVICINNKPFSSHASDPEPTKLMKFFASYRDVPPPWKPGDPI